MVVDLQDGLIITRFAGIRIRWYSQVHSFCIVCTMRGRVWSLLPRSLGACIDYVAEFVVHGLGEKRSPASRHCAPGFR